MSYTIIEKTYIIIKFSKSMECCKGNIQFAGKFFAGIRLNC